MNLIERGAQMQELSRSLSLSELLYAVVVGVPESVNENGEQ